MTTHSEMLTELLHYEAEQRVEKKLRDLRAEVAFHQLRQEKSLVKTFSRLEMDFAEIANSAKYSETA